MGHPLRAAGRGRGAFQIPGVDQRDQQLPRPVVPRLPPGTLEPSTGTDWIGLLIGAIVGLFGITHRLPVLRADSGRLAAPAEAAGAGAHFLVNKWYFDELIDYVVVRPALLIGRVCDSVLEQIVISGGVTGGITGLIRAGSATVRRAQTGFLRYYAAAIISACRPCPCTS